MGNEDAQLVRELAGGVETIADHGRDLAELQDAASVFRKLGKATAALGIVGVGFDVALALFDSGPSVDEEILSAVNKLSGKVDVLWGRLEGKFEDLEAENNLRAAKAGVREEITALRTLGQSVRSRNIEELRRLGTFEIRRWVNNLADHARGSALHHNIFKAVYESSQGSPDQMYCVGTAMVDSAIVGLIASGMIQADQLRAEQRSHLSGSKAPGEMSLEQRRQDLQIAVGEALRPALTTICDEFAHWQQRCFADAEVNIGKVFEKLVSKLDALESDTHPHIASEANYRGVAQAMLAELIRTRGSYEWLVIVGQPTSQGSPDFDWAVNGDDIVYSVDLNRANFKGQRSSALIAARLKEQETPTSAKPFAQVVQNIAEELRGPDTRLTEAGLSGVLWHFRKGVKWSAAWSDPVNVEVGIVTGLRDGEPSDRVHWQEPGTGWDALLWGAPAGGNDAVVPEAVG